MYLTIFISFLIILLIDRNKVTELKRISLFFSVLILILFILQNLKLSNFDDLQYTFINSWSNSFGLGITNTLFYVDGISHFFIGLSVMLIVICYLISWENVP